MGITGYSIINLGASSVPTPYGGISFKYGDTNTLLLGGNANYSNGVIYTVPVVRDPTTHHVTGFGSATQWSTAPYIQSALVSNANGTVLYIDLSQSEIVEIPVTGGSPSDYLSGYPVGGSVGAIQAVPSGYSGSPNLIQASVDYCQYCTTSLWNSGPCIAHTNSLGNGPLGTAYLASGYPGFPARPCSW